MGLGNVIKFELSKILNRKKYVVISIILIVIAILSSILTSGFASISIKSFSLSANLPLSMLPGFTSIILPLVIYMLCSDLIAEEFGNGSIKAILLRPVDRFKVYGGKCISIVIYIFWNLLILMVASIIINALSIKSLDNLWLIFISFLVSILPMTAFVAFGALVSSLIKSSSMAMFLMILLHLGLATVNFLFGSIGATLFTTYTGFYKLFIGTTFPVMNVISISFLLLSNILIFFILGFLRFDKKEV